MTRLTVEGKESAQKLLRAIAGGAHPDWMKTMVLLVAPIYNADGNERVALTNRGLQYGPSSATRSRPIRSCARAERRCGNCYALPLDRAGGHRPTRARR